MSNTVSEEQAILSTLSPAMRRALLAAEPLNAEPEFDTPAEYCQGHESLDGAHMGVTVHCENNPLCADAWNRFHADRIPDPDRLAVTISPDVTIGTVVALIGRGLVEHAANSRTRDHELTDRGLCILHALKALQERGQAGAERPSGLSHRQRRRANLAFSAATSALNEARAQGRLSMAYSHSIAAALESLADSGDTSPATLRVIASVFREV